MVDFYDVKGDLEHLPGPPLDFVKAAHPALHPGQSARILLDGKEVGWLGTLHHRLAQKFDLPAAPVLFELELDALTAMPLPRHRAIARFPSMRRDLAFLVDADLSAGALLATMREAAEAIVQEIEVFDLYQGQGCRPDKKALLSA